MTTKVITALTLVSGLLIGMHSLSHAGHSKIAPAIAAATPAAASAGFDPRLVYLRTPIDMVQSGLGPMLHVELKAMALASAANTAERVSHALALSDESGNAVPIHIDAALDEDGMAHLDVTAAAPQAVNRWLYLTVSAIDSDVQLEHGADSWSLSLYTGDLVYVQRLVQSTNPNKQDEVYLRFSQPVKFDARSAQTVLADAGGGPLAGCVHFNGRCVTEGQMLVHDVAITLPKGSGGKLGRFHPQALGAVVGRAARRIDSLARRSRLADGSLALGFEPCEHGFGRCAYF